MTQAGVGTNRYAYAGGDPVNGVDPGGHEAATMTIGAWLTSILGGGGVAAGGSAAVATGGTAVVAAALVYGLAKVDPAMISNTSGGCTAMGDCAGETDDSNSDGSASEGSISASPGSGCEEEDDCNPDDSPIYYRGGDLKRGPNDLNIDKETGLAKPTRGVSIDTNSDKVLKFGKAGSIDLSTLPEELQIVQRGMSSSHFEIVPRAPMTVEKFDELLKMIRIIGQ